MQKNRGRPLYFYIFRYLLLLKTNPHYRFSAINTARLVRLFIPVCPGMRFDCQAEIICKYKNIKGVPFSLL